jgi:hypothetical protein
MWPRKRVSPIPRFRKTSLSEQTYRKAVRRLSRMRQIFNTLGSQINLLLKDTDENKSGQAEITTYGSWGMG